MWAKLQKKERRLALFVLEMTNRKKKIKFAREVNSWIQFMDYLSDYLTLMEYFQEKFLRNLALRAWDGSLIVEHLLIIFINHFREIKNIKPSMHVAAQYRHDVFLKFLDFDFSDLVVPILTIFPELREILFEKAAFNV